MRMQHGYLTKECGSWLGHYSVWQVDGNGEKKRVQRAFAIAPVDGMTRVQAKSALREHVV